MKAPAQGKSTSPSRRPPKRPPLPQQRPHPHNLDPALWLLTLLTICLSNMSAIALNTHRVLELLERTTPDTVHRQALKERIIQREETGFKKYGRTMDRRDYEQRDWLLHLLEELMDAAQYAMRAGDTELANHLLEDAYRIQKRLDDETT